MNQGLRDYFEAAALGNGKPKRFAALVRRLGKGFVILHFFLITAMLHFPVLFSIARLSPWEVYSRLYGSAAAADVLDAETLIEMVGEGGGNGELAAPGETAADGVVSAVGAVSAGPEVSVMVADTDAVAAINAALYAGGYGSRVLPALLVGSFLIILICQVLFYLSAALFLGLRRMTGSEGRRSFWERAGIFVMASTPPVIVSAIVGIWIPTLHVIVFYLFTTLIGFFMADRADRAERLD